MGRRFNDTAYVLLLGGIGMKKEKLLLFCCLFYLLLLTGCESHEITDVVYKEVRQESDIEYEKYIAHAGGSIEGVSYTNCKEAINSSYNKGYRFIELDFISTADGNFILLHGWKDGSVKKLFNEKSKIYSLEEFKDFKMINGWTQLSLFDLIEWLRVKKDVFIVTDAKDDNIRLLKLIKEKYGDVQHQIIPQIYYMEEYSTVSELGYENIILTLYRTNYTDRKIVNFSMENHLFAITMPKEKAGEDLVKTLNQIGVCVYIHTVNNEIEVEKYEKSGVYGFYTDILLD